MLTYETASNSLTTRPRVLVIEHCATTAHTLTQTVSRAGMPHAWAGDAAAALDLLDCFRPQIVLLDNALPDVSGFSLLSRLAAQRDLGVLVLSAFEDEADRIVGLEMGADDVIAKPPPLRELVARIRAVHRRVSLGRRAVPSAQVLHVGPIRINLTHRTVQTEEGRPIALTGAEFNALEALVSARGAPVSRDRLSETALGRPWRADRSVDQLVFNLRHKLPRDEHGAMLIQSIRTAGYWLRAPDPLPGFAPGPLQEHAEAAELLMYA